MKKKYRLLKQSDFQRLLKKGNRAFSSNFICYWRADKTVDNAQIGIIIPKKKCKLSTRRKKYKRVFWAINNPGYESLPKMRCVFFYKDTVFDKYENGELTFVVLRQDYWNLVSRMINGRR